jgi:hypothetical protein
VTDADADLDVAAAEWLQASPWLDIPVGADRPPLAEMLRDARRQVEAQVGTQIYAVSEHIFSSVQRRARELVEEVAALPPFPANVWLAPSPAEVLGRIPVFRGHASVFPTPDKQLDGHPLLSPPSLWRDLG